MDSEEQAEQMSLYDARNIFHIVASAQSKKDLDRHQCMCKSTSTGFIVGLKVEMSSGSPQTYTPFHPLDDDLLFTFHLHLQDFELLNYTALPLTDNAGKIYLFNNLKGTFGKTYPSLAAHPQKYTGDRTYMPGDMVVDNADTPTKLYTAKVKTSADPTSSSEDWLTENADEGLPMSHVTENDRYPIVRQQLLYRVKTADVEPEVVIKNALGTVMKVTTKILPGDYRTIQIDLRGLPEGLYSLKATSADQSYNDDLHFYLLQQQEAPFAVLQLAVKSDIETSNYDMLDVEGCLRSPVYELRLRNRATHWRYKGKQFNASSVTHDPLPLTRFGLIDNVSVEGKNGSMVEDLPSPALTMIKAEALSIDTENKFYSEIHIN